MTTPDCAVYPTRTHLNSASRLNEMDAARKDFSLFMDGSAQIPERDGLLPTLYNKVVDSSDRDEGQGSQRHAEEKQRTPSSPNSLLF